MGSHAEELPYVAPCFWQRATVKVHPQGRSHNGLWLSHPRERAIVEKLMVTLFAAVELPASVPTVPDDLQ